MVEDLIQILTPRQDYVMSNNDNDRKLADTIYIICWGVDEPTLSAIVSKSFFMTEILRKSGKKCCSKLLRPGDTFLIKLLSLQRVNDLGFIGKVLASAFEWYVNRQYPDSLKISLSSLV